MYKGFISILIMLSHLELFSSRFLSSKALLSRLNQNKLCLSRLSFRQQLMMSTESDGPTKKGKGKKDVSKYSATVLLPQTTFDQRANSAKREPELQKWWETQNIYKKLASNNPGETFVLHDGPPYANGDLHIGHALNKILKDFINKYQILRGRKVHYIPGWDCHGLPVELKVLQSIKQKERESLTPIALRKKAAEFAKEAVYSQMESFKRYGIWGHWDQPYMTLQPEYEAAQIRVFGQMVTKGHIYRGKKPVHWSPSSRTALAEAELEYPENHISKSIYVAFEVVKPSDKLSSYFANDISVAIWTTTPWTIPANLAVAVNSALEYSVVSHPKVMGGRKLIIAKDLMNTFSKKVGLDGATGDVLQIHATMTGEDLASTTYRHPLYDRVSEVVIGGDYITTESGTGLVHTAPGHGQEDYLTGLKYNLPLLSPVNDLGHFTEEAGPAFAGLDVLGAGNIAVIDALNSTNALIKQEDYNHKYPYDWRTKKPTIFRATEQWFASVSSFRQEALAAIDSVKWTPSMGRNRIYAMTESRGDWCISRQRSWGVPIPVFYKKSNNEPLMTPETLHHIESVFRASGSDAWWELDISELLPEGPLREAASEYTKGTDTMDVWFDSGTSWAGVVQERTDLSFPADVYLEGSDQHRGWFQSSLLTAVAATGSPPYKNVLTHGFVLDEKGYKMSKSLGNVVSPMQIIDGGANQKEFPALGADTLRLWVSGVDYTSDVCVGANIMKQVSESYRKLRNTLRYLIGNLADFNAERDGIPWEQLPSLDKYILEKLTATVVEVEKGYDQYEFYRANAALMQFAVTDLSSFYLDVAKDRLYISYKNDFRRRSCQTVLKIVLEQLTTLMAPIIPHMAEDVWQNLPYVPPTASVFESGWIPPAARYPPSPLSSEEGTETQGSVPLPVVEEINWEEIRALRNDVNRCIEKARTAKEAGASQEVKVVLFPKNEAMRSTLGRLRGDNTLQAKPGNTNGVDDLRFVFMTSQVDVVVSLDDFLPLCPDYNIMDREDGLVIGVCRASGKKCDRCWYYSETVGEDGDHPELCPRCADAVKIDGYVVAADVAASV